MWTHLQIEPLIIPWQRLPLTPVSFPCTSATSRTERQLRERERRRECTLNILYYILSWQNPAELLTSCRSHCWCPSPWSPVSPWSVVLHAQACCSAFQAASLTRSLRLIDFDTTTWIVIDTEKLFKIFNWFLLHARNRKGVNEAANVHPSTPS